MATHTASPHSLAAPTQVWAHLDSDRQLRAIHLMAQMAANLAASHPAPLSTEVPDALPSHDFQDPKRPSDEASLDLRPPVDLDAGAR